MPVKMDTSSTPVFDDTGLLFLSFHTWNSPWRSYHYLMMGLSRFFHVVWSDPSPGWRKLGASQKAVKHEENLYEPIPPDLTIYHPERWLPSIGRPHVLAQWTRHERLKRARTSLLSRNCRRTILFLCHPSQAWALEEKFYDLSCYRISDEYSWSEIERPVASEEADLISRADQVFILSRALLEKKGHLNAATVLVPNGVDYASYSALHVEPEDLKSIPRPRIGYVGVLKHQLDFPLLLVLAQQHKNWSFVLVGPQGNLGKSAALFQKLLEMENVHWLGGKRQKDIPAYMQHMDVCTLPYKVNGYTKFIYPLKLHAYLACGRPVIGTPIRTLQDFSKAITLARTQEEWSNAITNSFSSNGVSHELVAANRQISRQHDWTIIVNKMVRAICEKMDHTYIDQLEKALSEPKGGT